MVTCLFGEIKLLGTAEDISVDFMSIMDGVNKMKEKDKDTYDKLTENINHLIRTDDNAKDCILTFVENLHDLL